MIEGRTRKLGDLSGMKSQNHLNNIFMRYDHLATYIFMSFVQTMQRLKTNFSEIHTLIETKQQFRTTNLIHKV